MGLVRAVHKFGHDDSRPLTSTLQAHVFPLCDLQANFRTYLNNLDGRKSTVSMSLFRFLRLLIVIALIFRPGKTGCALFFEFHVPSMSRQNDRFHLKIENVVFLRRQVIHSQELHFPEISRLSAGAFSALL